MTWDQLISKTGKTVEEVGRMLHGRGRKKPKSWSLDELTDLRDALSNCTDVLTQRIESIQDGIRGDQ